MIREELLIHEVTVVTPDTSISDNYGNPLDVYYEGMATFTPTRAWVQQTSTGETITSEGDRTITTCLLITNTPLTVKQRVIWDGNTYTVEGLSAPMHDQHGVHHYETNLKRVTG